MFCELSYISYCYLIFDNLFDRLSGSLNSNITRQKMVSFACFGDLQLLMQKNEWKKGNIWYGFQESCSKDRI